MYFLLIFESIGTAELILIGIVALIFLGPRKLPSIAKTIGKTMADLRNTTNEFKSTWEREVNFEDEAKALRTGDLTDSTVERAPQTFDPGSVSAPEIREMDPAEFNGVASQPADELEAAKNGSAVYESEPPPVAEESGSEKRNWL